MRQVLLTIALCLALEVVHCQDDDDNRPSPGGLVAAIQAIGKFGNVIKKATSCLEGENGEYNATTCEETKTRCLTRIEINHDWTRARKECKEEEACVNLQSENSEQCTGAMAFKNQVRICHYCCNTDNCNEKDPLERLVKEKSKRP